MPTWLIFTDPVTYSICEEFKAFIKYLAWIFYVSAYVRHSGLCAKEIIMMYFNNTLLSPLAIVYVCVVVCVLEMWAIQATYINLHTNKCIYAYVCVHIYALSLESNLYVLSISDCRWATSRLGIVFAVIMCALISEYVNVNMMLSCSYYVRNWNCA